MDDFVSKPAIEKGLKVARLVSAATTNATLVKALPGQVYGWYMSNTSASPVYIKLYDKATAPTVGTDVPKMTLMIPGNTSGVGANCNYEQGIEFLLGIGYGTVTGAADSSTTAVGANEVVLNLFYY